MQEASVYHEGVCAGACGLREIVLNISVRLLSRQMDEGFSLKCSPRVSGGPSTCFPASSQQNSLTIGRGMRGKPKGSRPQDKLVILVIKEKEGEEKGEGEEERKKSQKESWPSANKMAQG